MMFLISSKFGEKPGTIGLIKAANKRGFSVHTVMNSIGQYKTSLSIGERIIVYGEPAFCEFVAQEFNHNIVQNSLDWITKIDKFFLKRNVSYMTIDEASKIEKEHGGILNNKVLEPADDQCFNTGMYNGAFPKVPGKTPILVHPEEIWDAKFRFIIIDGKIATKCCYRLSNIFNTPTIWQTEFIGDKITSEAFVKTLISHYNTAHSCIIDVGFIKDRGWCVCGTYPIWSSDPYGCNSEVFLSGLIEACRPLN